MEELEERALRLHREALVVDTHCDTLQCLFPGRGSPPITPLRVESGLGGRSDKGHLDIPRMVEGGVDCQVFAVFAAPEAHPPRPLNVALQLIDVFYRECEKNADRIVPVFSYEEIIAANRDEKIAALLSVEGGEALEGKMGVLRMLYRLGVRMMSLTWNWRNELADGVGEEGTTGGLSNLGVRVVEEMNRLGMIIDVSHLSDAGFWSLMNITKGPVMASHSNCRALCNHRRNLTDDQIRAIAEKGGVIGVTFPANFIHAEKATVERLVDHVDHIVKLVGADHVGLGSDFDGTTKVPEGLEDVTRMPNITKALVARGYPEEDIRKILGENHLRVFKEILH